VATLHYFINQTYYYAAFLIDIIAVYVSQKLIGNFFIGPPSTRIFMSWMGGCGGQVVTSPRKIAVNYVKGWFIIDAIAAVPFDLILFTTGTSDVSR